MFQLLRHGPMPMAELIVVAGWKPKACEHALRPLLKRGDVRAVNVNRRRCYAVTHGLLAEPDGTSQG